MDITVLRLELLKLAGGQISFARQMESYVMGCEASERGNGCEPPVTDGAKVDTSTNVGATPAVDVVSGGTYAAVDWDRVMAAQRMSFPK